MVDVDKFVCELAREKEKVKPISDLLVKLGQLVCADTGADSFNIEAAGHGRGKSMKVLFKGVLNESSK